MKKNKTILFSAMVIALLAVVSISGCKKEEATDNNWASKVTGIYNGTNTHAPGGSYATIVTIVRVNDNTVTFNTVETINGFNSSMCFDSVKLTNASAFTINEFEGCDYNQPFTGTGTFSNNSLTATLDGGFYTIVATK